MRAVRVLVSTVLLLLFPLLSQATLQAQRRPVRGVHRRHRVRRLVFRSPIRGSRASLMRQNLRLDEDNLQRIQNDEQLQEMVQNNQLVALPEDRSVTVSPKLPEERRFCRPWTADFVQSFADKFYATFHHPLEVTSAVRTVEVQRHLQRINHNAAAESGELASPHLSGATVDIGKKGLSWKELAWARKYLLQTQTSGLIDVEEEFRQSVFHITVYRNFQVVSGKETAAAETAAGNP